MWRNLDVKKFEMYRVEDNMIHTVLPWHGWCLCSFVAKSSVAIYPLLSRHFFLLQFTHFLFGAKLSPTFCLWRKNDKYDV